MALEAFQQTSGYDTAIARTLHERWIGAPESVERVEDQADRLPAVIRVAATQSQVLRYGKMRIKRPLCLSTLLRW